MPIYEYECPDCNHHFEDLQKLNDEPIKVCPKCQGNNVRKIFPTSNFRFKDPEKMIKDDDGSTRPISSFRKFKDM